MVCVVYDVCTCIHMRFLGVSVSFTAAWFIVYNWGVCVLCDFVVYSSSRVYAVKGA